MQKQESKKVASFLNAWKLYIKRPSLFAEVHVVEIRVKCVTSI